MRPTCESWQTMPAGSVDGVGDQIPTDNVRRENE